MKIIIIGSGIAGLTLAIACERSGMDVVLYEKAAQLQHIGGGILLWPHGLRYLKWLGLEACLAPFHLPIAGCEIKSHIGEAIFSEAFDALYSHLGGEILPIDRSLLQQALVAQLGRHTLQLAKACVSVSSDNHQARVVFADGTQDSADIVVGADGIHSVVRQFFSPAAMQVYTQYCWWGGMIDQAHAPFLSTHQATMALHVGKLFIAWPTTQQRFMWYLPVKMPLTDFKTGQDGFAQLQAICGDWSDEIKQVITAPACAQRFHLPIHTVAPQATWSSQRIVLIGDAAHTLGPILGQGASQAIEDAFLLFHCLKHSHEQVEQSLARYENLRREKYQRLAFLENQTAEQMIYEDQASLDLFQQQIHELDFVSMYQDLIPLINEAACVSNLKQVE